ncbi:hypothetical protein GQ54DRAFT_296075 [Martensiomyces pterosporus]|nr:hypothetical protein GQ54DRAFT_296075 [Martensiomyces pterosporus]
MLEYYEAKRDSCHATFLLTGRSKQKDESSEEEGCGDGSRQSQAQEVLVRLVSSADLSEAEKEVEGAAYHIYSVERKSVGDKNALVVSNISTGSNRDMADLSAVAGSTSLVHSDAKTYAAVKQENSTSVKAEKQPRVIAAGASTCDSDATKEKEKEKEKEKKEEKETGKAKSTTSFFGRQLSRTSSAKKPAKAPNAQQKPADPAPIATRPKPERPKEPEHAVASKSREVKIKLEPTESADSDSAGNSATANPAQPQLRVEDMFDDDDDFEDASNKPTISGDEPEPEREPEPESSTPAANADSQDSSSMDVEPSPASNESNPPVEVSESQAGERRRVRKRRKVSKIKHTKNKRGMLVTQTVDEWESYSESDSEPEIKPRKANMDKKPEEHESTGSKRSAGKNKKSGQQQQSLLSFFGKK